MERFTRRLRIAKGLLWLALVTMVAAQFLPWERVPIEMSTVSGFGQGDGLSSFLPVTHFWLFEEKSAMSKDESPFPWGRALHDLPYISSERGYWGDPPEALHPRLMEELWICGKTWLRHPSFDEISVAVPAVTVGWILTMAFMFAMPFLAGSRQGRGRALWIPRIYILFILAWSVRHLLRACHHNRLYARVENVGWGYWFTLMALGLATAALFLIANPATKNLHVES